MTTTADPQTSIYETVIEDESLEQAIEAWFAKKKRANTARKDADTAKEIVSEKVDALDLGIDAPVRVGRFVVSIRDVEPRSVSYETEQKKRLVVKPIPGV